MISWSLYIVAIWLSIISSDIAYRYLFNKGLNTELRFWFIVIIIPVSPFILTDYIW